MAFPHPVSPDNNYFVSRYARVVKIRLIRVIRVPLQIKTAPNPKSKIRSRGYNFDHSGVRMTLLVAITSATCEKSNGCFDFVTK